MEKELQRERPHKRGAVQTNSSLCLKDTSNIIQEVEFSFLSQVSHELRQPLETIMLVKDIIYSNAENCKTKMLLKKLDHSANHISRMFDTFKDIDNVHLVDGKPQETFHINDVFNALKKRLCDIITDFKVDCRFLPTNLMIKSNRILLEEALYHIIKHIIFKTNKKRIVLGCRKHRDTIRLEIWYSENKSKLKAIAKLSDSVVHIFNNELSTKEKGYINAFLARNILNRLGYTIEEIREDNFTSLIRISSINNNNSENNLLSQKKQQAISSEFKNSFDNHYSNKKREHICIISDFINYDTKLKETLEGFGYEVSLIYNEKDFETLNNINHVSFIILDNFSDETKFSSFLNQVRRTGYSIPIIVVSENTSVRSAVTALQNGAHDFIEAPLSAERVIESIQKITIQNKNHNGYQNGYHNGNSHNNSILEALTPREKQILEMVIDGNASKIIASDLGVSQRTIENHRASIMRKTGTRSIASLVRLVVTGIIN